jgi:hypothetical protein
MAECTRILVTRILGLCAGGTLGCGRGPARHPATARVCDKPSALVDGQWRGPARRLRDQFTALVIAQGLRCIADETARSHRLYVRRARCAYTRALCAPSRHWHHVTTSHPRQCDASAATAVAKRAWHIPPTPRQLLLSPQPRAHRHASCARAVATAMAPSPHAVAHWTCAIASAARAVLVRSQPIAAAPRACGSPRYWRAAMCVWSCASRWAHVSDRVCTHVQ